VLTAFGAAGTLQAQDEDGYRMWLRYEQVGDPARLQDYRSRLGQVVVSGNSATAEATRRELEQGLNGLLGAGTSFATDVTSDGTLLVGTPTSSNLIAGLGLDTALEEVGREGFLIEERTVN